MGPLQPALLKPRPLNPCTPRDPRPYLGYLQYTRTYHSPLKRRRTPICSSSVVGLARHGRDRSRLHPIKCSSKFLEHPGLRERVRLDGRRREGSCGNPGLTMYHNIHSFFRRVLNLGPSKFIFVLYAGWPGFGTRAAYSTNSFGFNLVVRLSLLLTLQV